MLVHVALPEDEVIYLVEIISDVIEYFDSNMDNYLDHRDDYDTLELTKAEINSIEDLNIKFKALLNTNASVIVDLIGFDTHYLDVDIKAKV